MIQLNTKQKQALKAKAHHLKPVIITGAKGLTEAVIDEVNIALDAHELIKIKIPGYDREERGPIIAQLCEQTNATLIQKIGQVVVIYRKKPEN